MTSLCLKKWSKIRPTLLSNPNAKTRNSISWAKPLLKISGKSKSNKYRWQDKAIQSLSRDMCVRLSKSGKSNPIFSLCKTETWSKAPPTKVTPQPIRPLLQNNKEDGKFPACSPRPTPKRPKNEVETYSRLTSQIMPNLSKMKNKDLLSKFQ